MIKQYPILLSLSVCFLLLLSCIRKQTEEIKPDQNSFPGQSETEVLYTGAIQTLFQSKCSGCHSQDGPGTAAWNFNGYTSVTGNADHIRQAVLVNKTMPIGGSLTATELKSLQDWFNQGMKP